MEDLVESLSDRAHSALFGGALELVSASLDAHRTPSGEQQYLHAHLRRQG